MGNSILNMTGKHPSRLKYWPIVEFPLENLDGLDLGYGSGGVELSVYAEDC